MRQSYYSRVKLLTSILLGIGISQIEAYLLYNWCNIKNVLIHFVLVTKDVKVKNSETQ